MCHYPRLPILKCLKITFVYLFLQGSCLCHNAHLRIRAELAGVSSLQFHAPEAIRAGSLAQPTHIWKRKLS